MRKSTKKIAAVVVTFNRLEFLKECVAALRNQTRIPDEIIVINNSSSDGTNEWLNEQSDLIVVTQKNKGSAGGQSAGIKTAYDNGCDWIWCMDDDCLPDADALKILLNNSEDDDCLAAAGRVVDEQGNSLIYHRGYLPNDRISSQILQIPIEDISCREKSGYIQFASFVGILLKRDVVELIGLPDERLFIHHDDVEYCLRISSVGRIKYIPQSLIVHKELNNRSLVPKKFMWKTSYRVNINSFWINYYSVRNYVYLVKKYSVPLHNQFISLILDYFRFIRRILLYDDYKWIRGKIITKAYYDGLNGRLGEVNVRQSIQEWIKNDG